MDQTPLEIALLGAGRWARAYVKTLSAVEGTRLSWIARARNEIPEFLPQGCRFTTDWRAAVADPAVGGVIVATPPREHAAMARFALERGKAVLIEKPVTTDLHEAEALLAEARGRGAVVMVEHTYLFHPAFRALKAHLPAIGAIEGVHSVAGNWGPFRKNMPILWDWGAHDAAMYLDLFGELPSRAAVARTGRRESADGVGEMFRAEFEGPGGAPVRLEFGNLLEKRTRRFTVYGRNGALVFDDANEPRLQRCPYTQPFEPPLDGTAIDVDGALPLTVAVREFAEAARRSSPQYASLGMAVDVSRLLTLFERSLA